MDKERENFKLKEALAEWGYDLFKAERREAPSFYLKQLVQSHDPRLQEGFPVVFANWVEKSVEKPTLKYELDEFLKALFRKEEGRNRLIGEWVALSLALMQFFNVYENRVEKLISQLETQYKLKETVQKYRNAVLHRLDARIGFDAISLSRLTKTFLSYVVEKKTLERKSLSGSLERRSEFETEFYLSLLFSPKQKEILKKKLENQSLTKTEREYFSRVIRKRLVGIADPGIQSIVRELTR